MEIIKLPRRAGKTTRALERLRDNEKSVMFQHAGLRIDHPILENNPELRKRIFTTCDFKSRLRGMVIDTVIIDNADLLDKHLLLEMLHHFTTFPLNLNSLCNIVVTFTEEERKPRKHDCQLHRMEICEQEDGHLYMKIDTKTYMMGGPDMHPVEFCPVCGMKARASHIEHLTIFERDDLKESQLDHMHKIIMEMFLSSCDILVKEDLDDKSFKFCTDTIQNTLMYVAARRRE